MASDPPAPAPVEPAEPEPTVHEAELASGPSGAVEWGAELTEEQAVQRRKQGKDIVVRGPKQNVNKHKARQIESAVGPCEEHEPHARAGPMALPHFQQGSPPPAGHSFYERTRRKAKRKP